jgi:hypothetical protein
MHHWLQLAAVVPAAIALAVWLYELAFVSRKTLSASRPISSKKRSSTTKTGGLKNARPHAVVELSTGVTLVSAVVFSAWRNIKNRIGDYHTAHDEAGRKD